MSSAPRRIPEATRHLAMMVRLDIVLPIAAAIIGVAAAWSATGMGLVEFNKPGAGMFPFLIGIILTVLSIPAFIHSARKTRTTSAVSAERHTALEVTIFIGLIAYVLALPWFGFLVSSVAFVAFLFRIAARKSALVSFALGVILVVPIYLILAVALKVPVPQSSIL